MNNLIICFCLIRHSCLFICSVFSCCFCQSESIFTDTSLPYGAHPYNLHLCHSTVMPVLLFSSNSCRVMHCGCIGITCQLCLLSKLNIMTLGLSVVCSCSWFTPKTANIHHIFFLKNPPQSCTRVSHINTWTANALSDC